MQTVRSNVFILLTLIGTIDFYHFVMLSLTLTLSGDHKVSTKQHLLASFSGTLFIWSGWNLMWWWSSSHIYIGSSAPDPVIYNCMLTGNAYYSNLVWWCDSLKMLVFCMFHKHCQICVFMVLLECTSAVLMHYYCMSDMCWCESKYAHVQYFTIVPTCMWRSHELLFPAGLAVPHTGWTSLLWSGHYGHGAQCTGNWSWQSLERSVILLAFRRHAFICETESRTERERERQRETERERLTDWQLERERETDWLTARER